MDTYPRPGGEDHFLSALWPGGGSRRSSWRARGGYRSIAAVGALLCVLTCDVAGLQAAPRKAGRPVTHAQQKAVILAIEDEVYALKLQGYYGDVGRPVGEPFAHRLTAYIQPTLHGGAGWVIYKLMPYGQVYRLFKVFKTKAGDLAVLYGKPSNGFPPTEPSYLTVYMSSQELCRLEGTWRRVGFVIQIKPSASRVRQAVGRQKERMKR